MGELSLNSLNNAIVLNRIVAQEQLNLKSNIDHIHVELHTHINSAILDGLSDLDNRLMYNGTYVGNLIDDTSSSLEAVYSSMMIDNLLSSKSNIDHIHDDYIHTNLDVLNGFTDDAGTLLYNDINVITRIDDENIAINTIWSSDKINDELFMKADISHIHAELHVHDNFELLTRLSELDGKLQYNGMYIDSITIDDTISSNSQVWSSEKVQNELDNKSQVNHSHSEYIHENIDILNKIQDVNGRIQYNGNSIDGIRSIRVRDMLLTGTAFEFREGNNIKIDVEGNVLILSSIANGSQNYNTTTEYRQSDQLGVVAPYTVDISPSTGSLNFMPIDVYKFIADDTIQPQGGIWKKASYQTDYDFGYMDDTLLKVDFLTNGDYKICYGIYTDISSTNDIVFDGGDF